MMGYYGNNMMVSWGAFGIITWIILVVFLVLGSMYFWKEINRRK